MLYSFINFVDFIFSNFQILFWDWHFCFSTENLTLTFSSIKCFVPLFFFLV